MSADTASRPCGQHGKPDHLPDNHCPLFLGAFSIHALLMQDKILEMAELVDAGECVWFHRHTQNILSHPDPDGYQYSAEHDYLVEDVMQEVNEDFDNYIKIPALPSHDSYKIMEGFADTMIDERKRFHLFDALNSKKPFRHFRQAVETDGLLDDWHAYYDSRLQDYVMGKLEEQVL